MIDPADRADAGAFLVRLLRLDPGAVVRSRPARSGGELWAMLPFRVLVMRPLMAAPAGDITVSAAELLSVAGFLDGLEAQAFPSFGSERMGAPVVSYCRLDDAPIVMALGSRSVGTSGVRLT